MGVETQNGRLIAIGDVHGCADELQTLLTSLAPDAADELVFLGDYVDRGPASADVIELVIEVRRRWPRTICLRGNHEEMMLGFLGGDGSHGDVFLPNGGNRTLASYGLDAADDPTRGEFVADHIPAHHLEFLNQSLLLWHRRDRYAFVHAGVRPGIPLADQSKSDLLWIREPFLSSDPGLACTVVFGHTPRRSPLVDLPRKIGLDTGLVYGGCLSALDLTQGVLHQVEAGADRAERRSLHGWRP